MPAPRLLSPPKPSSSALEISAAGASTARPGSPYVYTFTYTNIPAFTGVKAYIKLPAHATYVSSSLPCAVAAGVATCTLGDLSADGSASFTFTLQVNRLKKVGSPLVPQGPPNYSIGAVGILPVSGTNNLAIDTVTPFLDVPATDPFLNDIQAVWAAGITNGCGLGSPLPFCPASLITRAELSVFFERSLHGGTYNPGTPPITYTDTASSPFKYWIEAFKTDGITSGCGPAIFCPDQTASRAQMAVMLLRASEGSSYSPPAATGTIFTDVSITTFAAAWIEQLNKLGYSNGCGSGKFCPDRMVTRAESASLLRRVFGFPLPTQ